MSWKARMAKEYTYFPKPYPLGTTSNASAMVKGSRKLRRSVEYPAKMESRFANRPSQFNSPLGATTTMTGLPWAARAKIEGKTKVEAVRESRNPSARLANYTFTYGLSKEDEERFRSELRPRFGVSVFKLSPGAPESQLSEIGGRATVSASAVISGRLKAIKESFHKAEHLPNQPKPYFQNWGNSKSEAINTGRTNWDDSDMIIHSTQNIFDQTGVHDGLGSYFDGLEDMDKIDVSDEDAEVLPMINREEATAAFQPSPKPSRLVPRTYYQVGQATHTGSSTSMDKSKSIVSAAGSSVSKKPSKRVRMAEPNPTIFIKSPPLKPTHQEKIIEKQLQREVAISPMTHEQYSSRKKELLEAALKAYDRDIPTYELIPDIRDEAMAAEEHSNAVARQNVMDLLYNALTNQSTTITVKSPSTSLHLSNPRFTNREKGPRTRPLDQFKGPVVSTILRELQEAKDSGEIPTQDFTPINASQITRHPTQKMSKERLKALRAIENYDLSKLRQQNSMAPKPVLTLLSVKKGQQQAVSKYSRVGGTTQTYRQTTEEVGTTTSGPGSFTALSNIQTRNEKYNGGAGRRVQPVRESLRKSARKPRPLLTMNATVNRRYRRK